jgi:predicted DNA binding CopG/RHH family protein
MTKEEEQAAFKAASAKIPGLPNLDFVVAGMPSDEEFTKTLAESAADIEAEFQAGLLNLDLNDIGASAPGAYEGHRPVPSPCLTKSKRISLRVPSPVLAACRAQAKLRGTKYQTFINRMLREAAASWVAPDPHV